MRGVTGVVRRCGPGIPRRARRGEATNRTAPYRFIYVRFDYVDGTAGDWVRACVRHTHTAFEGTDGNRARWLSEAERVRRIETRGRTDERTRATSETPRTEDG